MFIGIVGPTVDSINPMKHTTNWLRKGRQIIKFLCAYLSHFSPAIKCEPADNNTSVSLVK
jgi:hypothetical protein